ncbi:MAG: hypothetical protein FWG11_08755 [Promicromonosporaceae bacterium]|nr:hypothetical protein [Promicromonosporaceae bacterium]
MSTICFPLVGGRIMRATRLDACGRPTWGDCVQVTTEGFVSVAASANIEDGEAISVVNANGKQCVFQPAKPSITSIGLEVTFCDVDPELYALITGQRVVYDYKGDAVGFRVNTAVSPGDVGWALEIWSNVPGVACAPEDAGGVAATSQGTYGYLLYPFLQGGVLGDYTIENGAVTFSIGNIVTKSGGNWGKGPYDVVTQVGGGRGGLLEAIEADDHFHVQLTDVAPPEGRCGCVPLDNPSWPITETGVAGAPGNWGTASRRPDTLADLLAADPPIAASPTSAWPSGSWIVLGDGTEVYWDGTTWAEGVAPEVETVGQEPSYATSVTEGAPGIWDGTAPPDFATLTLPNPQVEPETDEAWTSGEYAVLGNGAYVYWDGDAWEQGIAP